MRVKFIGHSVNGVSLKKIKAVFVSETRSVGESQQCASVAKSYLVQDISI